MQPNLEQCGLLTIEYEKLKDVCGAPDFWEKHRHPLIQQATPEQRCIIIRALLDHLRKELAIDADLLQPQRLEQLQREVQQAIKDPWSFDPHESLHQARWASASAQSKGKDRETLKLTARSKIGRFLRSDRAWPWRSTPLSEQDYEGLIRVLLQALADAGYTLKEDHEIQLRIDALIWTAQQQDRIPVDPLTSRRLQGSETEGIEVNRFFQSFYQDKGSSLQNMEGREHTGQVKNQDRQERENRFRQGQLSTLFCSPTMELGIDISDLNVVHMRNVPPSPANYAQRSGRAGRSGQAAMVVTYASAGSGHDQYFFKRPDHMVAGIVAPPKLELGNQDLVKAHLHSVWLAYTGLYLENSMNQILDLEAKDYPLKDSIRSQLTLSSEALDRCFQATKTILQDTFCQADLNHTSWYGEEFLHQTLSNALISFDRACDRWRNLYQDAVVQLESSRQTIDRATKGLITQEQRQQAESQEREAKRQIDLLVGQTSQGRTQNQLEFYPYRYFASEGFLPGYNFPRLPVRAYIPSGNEGDFISRPLVVAIREFAPRNIVYYEGSKFQVSKTRMPVKGIESGYNRVALCPQCGYFHPGDDWQRDVCENCGVKITADSQGNLAKLNRVLGMDTMLTRRRERITCDEEERLKYGYNVTTHFRFNQQKQELATVVDPDGTKLLELSYGDAASIWRINRGLRSSVDKGFKLDSSTGIWGDPKSEEPTENTQKEVYLYVEDTCNVLLIKPQLIPQKDPESFLASFQYAIGRAIQAIYKLEENELASERLGQGEYILFWEASEGGAGVLSQVMEDPKSFQYIAQAALDIRHFTNEKESCIVACYECLLSYQNQFDHPLLNRHSIQPFLTQLSISVTQRHAHEMTREEQYQKLKQQIDPKSDFERVVLDKIYELGLKLPDTAQVLIPEVDVKPDFLCQDRMIAIFCDGSIHDHSEKRLQDEISRENLRYVAGYFVISLHYDEDWESKLKGLS